jgi:thymidylate kinase
MIVEIFGPQGVGKTTFARALAAELQKQHQSVDLVLSYRPAERSPAGPRKHSISAPTTAVAIRLTRPVVELLTMTLHPLAYRNDLSTTASLLKTLPPKNFLSSVRLSQYILRLSHSWHMASKANRVALFDQAFIQAVCSLALSHPSADETLIARALDIIPKPDLLIQLEAPPDILAARLHDRQRFQSPVERMLEVAPETNSEEHPIFEQLLGLLRKRGQTVTCINSSDLHSLDDAVRNVAEQIRSALPTLYRVPHMNWGNLSSKGLPHV